MANTSLVYPAPAIQEANLQYVKAVVPVGFATTVAIFTTAPGTRFYCTGIVIHDPQPAAAVGASVTMSFGSLSTTATSVTPLLTLTQLNGTTANQFLQVQPGLLNGVGATGSVVTFDGSFPVAYALGGNDSLTAKMVGVATTNATVQVDIIGYYI